MKCDHCRKELYRRVAKYVQAALSHLPHQTGGKEMTEILNEAEGYKHEGPVDYGALQMMIDKAKNGDPGEQKAYIDGLIEMGGWLHSQASWRDDYHDHRRAFYNGVMSLGRPKNVEVFNAIPDKSIFLLNYDRQQPEQMELAMQMGLDSLRYLQNSTTDTRDRRFQNSLRAFCADVRDIEENWDALSLETKKSFIKTLGQLGNSGLAADYGMLLAQRQPSDGSARWMGTNMTTLLDSLNGLAIQATMEFADDAAVGVQADEIRRYVKNSTYPTRSQRAVDLHRSMKMIASSDSMIRAKGESYLGQQLDFVERGGDIPGADAATVKAAAENMSRQLLDKAREGGDMTNSVGRAVVMASSHAEIMRMVDLSNRAERLVFVRAFQCDLGHLREIAKNGIAGDRVTYSPRIRLANLAAATQTLTRLQAQWDKIGLESQREIAKELTPIFQADNDMSISGDAPSASEFGKVFHDFRAIRQTLKVFASQSGKDVSDRK